MSSTNDKHIIALVFDTETTGLPKDRKWKASPYETDVWPRIVQLGMALLYSDGTCDQWCELIQPPDGKAFPIPQAAFKAHGISDEDCATKGVPLAAALEVFTMWCRKAPVLVAHNLNFDRKVILCEMVRLDALPAPEFDHAGKAIKQPTVCTQMATMDWLAIPLGWYDPEQPYKWPSLQDVHTRLFGEGFDGAHDAMVDVLATARCYHRLTQMGTFTDWNKFLPTQQ